MNPVGIDNLFSIISLVAASFNSYSPDSYMWISLFFIVIIIIVFIVWIAVGLWVYKDAKQRNESAILWFVIVIVAGLLGILLWFVFRPPIGGRKTTPQRICPNCGREIPFDANLCSYCGKKFESYL
jgi:H+/Cl- antiporter ClcA